MFNNKEWLEQDIEAVIDPAREIIDPHHHLWGRRTGDWAYNLDHLLADTGSGHHVTKTVFVECGAAYDRSQPKHLQSIGETQFITNMAAQSQTRATADNSATISAIICHTDLCHAELEQTLAAHSQAANGLLRGVRHDGAWTAQTDKIGFALAAPRHLYAQGDYIKGVKLLGKLGLSFDTWHFHDQNSEFLALARAVPETIMVLDHFGTPLDWGKHEIGSPAHGEILSQLKTDLAEIAKCPNVHIKLGGTAMTMLGFGWENGATPCTSDQFCERFADLYRFTIDTFGPDRCMFESNFPMDKLSTSYRTLWNGLKKIAAPYSEAQKTALFSGTAAKVYRL